MKNFNSISIRKATVEDVKILYKWVNDPVVRLNSLNSEIIQFESHESWFKNKISSVLSEIFIFSINSIPLGQVRFDIQGKDVFIDYSIDKKYRKRGFGMKILEKGIDKFLYTKKERNFDSFKAIVKSENIASIKIFEKLKFTLIDVKDMSNVRCHIFKKSII